MSKKIFYILLVFHCMTYRYLAQACSCDTFTYKPYLKQNKFLGKLPDLQKFCHLSLIGTKLSTSYTAKDEGLRTQDLTIPQQLKYGVRVFEISVCPQSTYFELYPDPVTKSYNFYNFLFEINKFLDENPGELVLLFIKQSDDCDILGSTKSNCEIVEEYIYNIWGGWRMVTSWKLDDIIGIYRNRILIASSDPSFAECAFNIKSQCQIGHIEFLKTQVEVDHSVKEKLTFSIRFHSPYKKIFKCSIQETSFYLPEYDLRTVAKDGGFTLGKFCGIPINKMMTDNLIIHRNSLNVVIAYYVTQELIDKINDDNFKNSSWRSG